MNVNYRISTVSDMTGIPRNTLIAWERRYGLLEPKRHDNGYRYYSEDDVGILLQIKNALKAGLKISEAVQIVRQRMPPRETSPTLGAVVHPLAGAELPMTGRQSPYAAFRDQLKDLLLAYRGDEARVMLAQLFNVPFDIKIHEIYFPILKTIGDLWEQGIVSVAQEHFASGIIRTHLAAQFVTMMQPSITARHAVCTTLPHDEHEIAALALGIQLSQSGYRVSYLGSKMPILDLSEFVATQNPDLLCISCITLPSQAEFEDYLLQVGKFARQGVRVVLGGRLLAGRRPTVPSGVEICPDWRSFIG